MAVHDSIRPGMQVLGSDGGMIGRVTGLHGSHVHLASDSATADAGHTVPLDWVARVDEHVHLNVTAELARERWANGNDGFASAAATTGGQGADAFSGVGRSKPVWIIGAIMLAIVFVLLVRGCVYGAESPDYEDDARGEISGVERDVMGPTSDEQTNAGTAAATE